MLYFEKGIFFFFYEIGELAQLKVWHKCCSEINNSIIKGDLELRKLAYAALMMILTASIFLVACSGGQPSGGTQPTSSSNGASSAGESSNTNSSNQEEVFKIGAVLPMTGGAAVFGEKFQNAYSLAVEEINEAGGVNGIKLEVVIEDSEERPEVGTTVTEKLVNDPEIKVLTGGRSSGVTFAVARIANQYQTPYLIDHGTTDLATQSGWEYVFRFNPTAGMYTNALQEYLVNETDTEKIAFIQVDNAFGDAIYDFGLKAFFEKHGYDVLHEKYDANALDLRPIMNKVKSFDPDVVIMTSGTDNEAAQLIRAAAEADVTPKLFVGTGGGHSIMGFYDQVGHLADYVLSTGPWHGDKTKDEWHAFANKYIERFGHAPGEHEVEGYVSIYIIADALSRAEGTDRESIKKALKETDMDTIFGPIKFEDFDGYTNQNVGITELTQWLDGELVPVYPFEYAEAELVTPFPGWSGR